VKPALLICARRQLTLASFPITRRPKPRLPLEERGLKPAERGKIVQYFD
jgi:hypothetical protein